MSKRMSVAVVCKGSAKAIAQISELTDTPVHQRSFEKHETNWDKCFICQSDSIKNYKAL